MSLQRLSWIVCFVAALVTAVQFTGVQTSTRIVGGTYYDISNYPYTVLLRYQNLTNCAGALVSTRHVVTAAHCVKGMPIDLINVSGGINLRRGIWSFAGQTRGVVKMWVHPRYSIQTFDSDIAVLKLQSAMTGRNIRPIRLPTQRLMPGQVATITGWGDRYENSYGTMRLNAVDVKMWPYKKCKNAYKSDVNPSMMCANNPGKDSCYGDDGGPLVRQGVLYGVVSWGNGCGRAGYPGIYANVFALRGFVAPLLKK